MIWVEKKQPQFPLFLMGQSRSGHYLPWGEATSEHLLSPHDFPFLPVLKQPSQAARGEGQQGQIGEIRGWSAAPKLLPSGMLKGTQTSQNFSFSGWEGKSTTFSAASVSCLRRTCWRRHIQSSPRGSVGQAGSFQRTAGRPSPAAKKGLQLVGQLLSGRQSRTGVDCPESIQGRALETPQQPHSKDNKNGGQQFFGGEGQL